MGSGQQDSLFAAPEACPLAEQDALNLQGTPDHSSSHIAENLLRLVIILNGPQGLLAILALDSQDGACAS